LIFFLKNFVFRMASPEPVLVDQVLQAHNSVRSKKASTDHFYLLNPNLDQQELEDYLPLGFPVLSHLSRFIDDEHQWGAYTKQHISKLFGLQDLYKGISQKMTIKVFNLNCEDASEFTNNYNNLWCKEMHCLPYPTLAFDVKYISMSSDLRLEISDSGEQVWVGVPGTVTKVPAFLMLGGLDWIIILKFPWISKLNTDYSVNHYEFLPNISLNNDILKFLTDELPALVGDSLEEHLINIELFIHNQFPCHSDFLFKCRKIEVKVLSLLAGNPNQQSHLDFLFHVLGGGNITSLNQEDTYLLGRTWRNLHPDIQDSCTSVIIAVYFISRVLYYTSLVNQFPEMTGACQLSQLSPVKFMNWFGKIIIEMAKNCTVLKPGKWPVITSRSDLYSCVCRDSETSYQIEPLFGSMLIPNWPHITFGGCRSLHQARLFTLETGHLICNPHSGLNFSSTKWEINSRLHQDTITLSLINKDFLEKLDFLGPVDPNSCLTIPDDFEKVVEGGRLKILNPATITQAEVTKAFKECKPRTWRVLLLEFVLLNPVSSKVLLNRLAEPTFDGKGGRNSYALYLNNKSADNDARATYDLVWGTHEMQDNPKKYKQPLKIVANQIKCMEDTAAAIKRKGEEKEKEAKKLKEIMEASVSKFNSVTSKKITVPKVPTLSLQVNPPPFDITKNLESWEEFKSLYPTKTKKSYLKRKAAYNKAKMNIHF